MMPRPRLKVLRKPEIQNMDTAAHAYNVRNRHAILCISF